MTLSLSTTPPQSLYHQAQEQIVDEGVAAGRPSGMPNFFFHLTMGYAALRAAGVPLGKADFDGFHVYPEGFEFP